MVIDCHVHAYPTKAYQLARLANALPERTVHAARRLLEMGLARPHAPTDGESRESPPKAPPLSIESLAALKRRGPARLLAPMEGAASVLGIPSAVLSGGGVDRLLASMSRYGIDRSVLIGAPPVAQNEWVLTDAVEQGGGRLIPVVTLADLPEDAPAEQWYAAYVDMAERGARGFKIHANNDGFAADHPSYRALFEAARDTGRFVIVHTGCFHVPIFPRKGPIEPAEFEPLFKEFPSVTICLAHMNREHPERAWAIMKRYPHVFADTSWQPGEAVRRAIDTVGAQQILFGSDWPLLHPELQLDGLSILERVTSPAERDQIVNDNALRFLGES